MVLLPFRHYNSYFISLARFVAVSGELEDGLAVTLSFAHASGDGSNEWELELEAVEVDRSVRILPVPGVRSLLDSIPDGRYAVATSGAKTYAHGCLGRVGIPPKVTITADDPRLRAGKARAGPVPPSLPSASAARPRDASALKIRRARLRLALRLLP